MRASCAIQLIRDYISPKSNGNNKQVFGAFSSIAWSFMHERRVVSSDALTGFGTGMLAYGT